MFNVLFGEWLEHWTTDQSILGSNPLESLKIYF